MRGGGPNLVTVRVRCVTVLRADAETGVEIDLAIGEVVVGATHEGGVMWVYVCGPARICPNCGADLDLELDLRPTGGSDAELDPLAPVVRRLEAERYGSPEPIVRPTGPDLDGYGTSK